MTYQELVRELLESEWEEASVPPADRMGTWQELLVWTTAEGDRHRRTLELWESPQNDRWVLVRGSAGVVTQAWVVR